MVKYACKTPTARVYEDGTAVREALPKRMPRVACAWQSNEQGGTTALFCSMGFNSPIFAGSNPAVCSLKAYRQWFGFVLRDAKRRYTKSCAGTFC